MKSIHRTASGRKAKELREEARTWKGEARKIRDAAPELEPAAREREREAERLEGEALEALEEARLEAVTVYLGDVVKTTAKGEKKYRYYFASWKVGDKVVNKYIGSPRKMTQEEAEEKARELKRRSLSLRP
ncbi:MAG TPA: hypothetical protein PKJ51_10895 [Methanothrix sp.]|nr:hypothetical protein [Methanothrix sp.]